MLGGRDEGVMWRAWKHYPGREEVWGAVGGRPDLVNKSAANKQRSEIRVPAPGPRENFDVGKSPLRMSLANDMDQGAQKKMRKCPPAGTGTKI